MKNNLESESVQNLQGLVTDRENIFRTINSKTSYNFLALSSMILNKFTKLTISS